MLPWASQRRRLQFPSITMPRIPSWFISPAALAAVISAIP